MVDYMIRINGDVYTFSSMIYYEDQSHNLTRVLSLDKAIRDFTVNTGRDYVTVLFDERYSYESIYEICTKTYDGVEVLVTYRTVPNLQEEFFLLEEHLVYNHFVAIV